MTNKKVQFYRSSLTVESLQGQHEVEYELSSGWRKELNGWGLLYTSDTRDRLLKLDLSIDETSEDYKKLLEDVRGFDIERAIRYFNRTLSYSGRNEGTRPHATETVAAGVLLRHVLHPDEKILHTPELVIPMTVIASNHTPSLRAGKYILAKECMIGTDILA